MVFTPQTQTSLAIGKREMGRDVEGLNCMITIVKLTNTVCIKPMLFLTLRLLIYHLLSHHLRTLGSHSQGPRTLIAMHARGCC